MDSAFQTTACVGILPVLLQTLDPAASPENLRPWPFPSAPVRACHAIILYIWLNRMYSTLA